jgi:hypothetical protein
MPYVDDDIEIPDGQSVKVRMATMDSVQRRVFDAYKYQGGYRSMSDASVRDARNSAQSARSVWIAQMCDAWRRPARDHALPVIPDPTDPGDPNENLVRRHLSTESTASAQAKRECCLGAIPKQLGQCLAARTHRSRRSRPDRETKTRMAWWPMMRGVTVTLPAAAEAKLAEIQAQRVLAEESMRASNTRAAAIAGDPQLQARLLQERDKHSFKFNQLSQLFFKIQQWLTELRLPPGSTLEPAPLADIELNGEKLSTVLEATRSEIQALRQHLVAVKAAPLPLEDQQKLAEDYVVQMLSAARPTVAVVRDQLRVTFRDSVIASTDDAIALLAWAAPDALYAALVRAMKAQPVRADAMSAEERIRRTDELSAQLLELEQREEALVLFAASDGIEIMRRPDADPRCVLGVVIRAKMTEAAA